LSTTAIDNIGLLVTCEPEFGDGPLGLVRDAAVVIEGERVVAIAESGAQADQRIDAGGRCVIPGFVDSHTHLVFAGDRAEEFAARMAGAPYAAGGIRSTVAQTKAGRSPVRRSSASILASLQPLHAARLGEAVAAAREAPP